jgi:hypothetical protein
MLYFVVWFGVLSALGGIAFLWMKGFIGGATVYLRCHSMWMAPAVNVAILGIAGLAALPVVMRLSRPMALRVTCVVLGSVGFLGILCLESGRTFSRIHFIPKVILAVGLAIALQSLIARCALGFERFVRHTTIGLILLVLVLTAVVGGRQYFHERENIVGLPDPPESTPNVLLIVLDTVRAQSMSLYGYERATTPFLNLVPILCLRMQLYSRAGSNTRLVRTGQLRSVLSIPRSQKSSAVMATRRQDLWPTPMSVILCPV